MKTKKILALLLCFVMAFSALSFTGCLGPKDVMGLKIDEECYVNKTPSIGYSEKTYNDTVKNIASLKTLVEKEEASDLACQILSLLVSTELYKLIDALSLANVYYYSDMSDEKNRNGYEDLYAKYSTIINEFKKLYPLFAESKYKTIFFGEDATDEEIQELVSKAVVSDELVALNGKVLALTTRYNDFTDAQIDGKEFDELYTELVNDLNKTGKIYGFDNYLQYSYAMEYSRDFTPADTLNFVNLLSGDVLNTVERSLNNCNDAIDSLGEDKLDKLDGILDAPFTSDDSKTILDGFYRSLGDEIYDVYKHVLNNGYYFIAQSENAYAGAFTNYFNTIGEPFMYFSSAYASVGTFVHEFGHYCRYYFKGNNDEGSYELMETHSQGAEWLFACYVSDTLSDAEKSYFINSKFFEDSYMVLVSACVGAAEVDIYSLADLSGADYYDIVGKRKTQLFGATFPEFYSAFITPEKYFRRVAVNSPGYYISYSVSLISSIQLFVKGAESYETGVASYQSILKTDKDYVGALKEAEIGSPFEKTTINAICSTFSNV